MTLSLGQAAVTLPANSMPDTTYAVAVTGNANETFHGYVPDRAGDAYGRITPFGWRR